MFQIHLTVMGNDQIILSIKHSHCLRYRIDLVDMINDHSLT